METDLAKRVARLTQHEQDISGLPAVIEMDEVPHMLNILHDRNGDSRAYIYYNFFHYPQESRVRAPAKVAIEAMQLDALAHQFTEIARALAQELY